MVLPRLSPLPIQQFLDNDGTPAANGKLYYYRAGTLNNAITLYLGQPNPDGSGSSWPNPIDLNASGIPAFFDNPEHGVYMEVLGGPQRWILKRANGTVVWDRDFIYPITTILELGNTENNSPIGEVLSFGGSPTAPITATAYPAGATYASSHGGTIVTPNMDNDFIFGVSGIPTFALEAMIQAPASGGITLTVGLYRSFFGAIVSECASNSVVGVRVRSTPFSTVGETESMSIKAKLSSADPAGIGGFAWGVRLIRLT